MNSDKTYTVLNDFFGNIHELEIMMREHPYFNEESRKLFQRVVPRENMTKDELKNHIKNDLRKSRIVVEKLHGWYEGFINDVLPTKTPNDILYEGITYPSYNEPYTVAELKRNFELKESEKTIRRWIERDRIPIVSNIAPIMVFRLDFQRWLILNRKEFSENPIIKSKERAQNILKRLNS